MSTFRGVVLLAMACRREDPEQTTVTVNNTITITTAGVETVTVTIVEPGTGLTPENYDPALVEVQRVQDSGGVVGTAGSGAARMGLTELARRAGQIAFCGDTFGVLDTTGAALGYEVQGFEPGCAHLAFDDDDADIVYTTDGGTLSGWDLAGMGRLPELVEPSAMEGVDFEGGQVWVALHGEGLGVFERNPANDNLRRVATYGTGLDNAWDVKVDGTVAYVCDGTAGLVVLDVTDPLAPTELGRVDLDGQARDIALDGTVAWVAALGGGLVAVDVSDPASPAVLSTTVANAVAVDVDAGRVFVANWTDVRVWDGVDPANPTLIGAARGVAGGLTDRVLAVAGFGELVVAGSWSVPTVYEVHPERVAPYLVVPEGAVEFPGDLPVDATANAVLHLRNDGGAPLTLFEMVATAPAFTGEPAELALGPGESGVVTLTYTASVATEERSTFQLWSDDPLQPVRRVPVVGNAAELGVGDPLPETTATLADATAWTSADLAGKVAVLSWFAPGFGASAAELADLEASLFEAYADQSLEVVGLHPGADSVVDYGEALGIGFPLGVETSSTHEELVAGHPALDPYPLNVVVDRTGVIRYVAREYDAAAVEAVVVALLAEP